METYSTEGIVLNALPFKEYDKILTLFTPHGIFKLFVKGKKRLDPSFQVLTSPFTIGEYHYNLGKSDLYRFHDGSILVQNLHLRESWEVFQSACKMAQTILSTQWPGKPTPKLYALFRFFLEKMSTSCHENILTTFFLKLLAHEGILQMEGGCAICERTDGGYRFGGERYCEQHAPPSALTFSTPEEEIVDTLVGAVSFAKITTMKLTSSLQAKISLLFEQKFNLK